MAPKEAVEKIDNLLISTTDNGCQDHTSLLACYKLFDKYLDRTGIERLVVLTSDGHSSRFDFETLKFCNEKKIRLFISPPDTTGVTQLLDQCNKNIHLEYKVAKENLFTSLMTINLEVSMFSLADMWDTWATPKTIQKAARKVGISEEGLNFTDMQQEKFFQAENLMDIEKSAHSPMPSSSSPALFSSTLSPASPKHLRKGSAMYWKAKFEMAQHDCNEKSLRLEEIPGLLTVQKVKPKQSTKSSTRVTQVHGSMEAKDLINLVKSIKEQKEQKVKSKEIQMKKKEKDKEDFCRCKSKCVCKEDRCLTTGLKECPSCHSILRSECSKAHCKVDGKKPKMLLPIAATKKRTSRKLFESFDESERETDVSEESDGDVDVSDDSDGVIETSDDEDKSNESQNEAAVLVFCFVYLKTYKD